MRGVWKMADPVPTNLMIEASKSLGIVKEGTTPEATLEQLKNFWSENKVHGMSFVNFEAALVRLGKGLRGKKRRVQ